MISNLCQSRDKNSWRVAVERLFVGFVGRELATLVLQGMPGV